MNNHKRSSTILLALFLCIMLPNALFAQLPGELKLEQLIHVDAQPFMTQGSLSHGYYVFRCKIQNQDKKPHKVTLVSENVASKSFDLQPGETINASLALPVTNPKFDNDIQVYGDNRKLYSVPCPMSRDSHSYKPYYHSPYLTYVPDNISISYTFLICRSLRKQFAEADCLFAEKDCQYWPQDRMDYSALDVILLTPEELAAAPAGVQTALKQFVLGGGVLWLFECGVQKEALEKIEWIVQLRNETNPETEDSIVVQYPAGFGIVAMTNSINSEAIQALSNQNEPDREMSDKETLSALFDQFGFTPFWFNQDNLNELQKYFPVVKDLSIPVMGIGIVIFLFVMLAGPINLFFLSKQNKRILLLVTVPVLSFLFAGAILLYVILSEGFTTDVRVSAAATLDQRNGMYASLSQYGVYARTTPRNVVFDSDDELNISDDSDSKDERFSIDWTSGKQVIRSHFAAARKPAYYKIRKTGTTRLKLDFDFNKTNPYVVNGLGKDVDILFVRDPEGNLWKAEKIAAGQKAALSSVSEENIENRNNETALSYYISTSMWDFSGLSVNVQRKAVDLRPGSYIATFSSSGPFVNTGISYAKEKNSFTYLLGRF